MGLDYKTAKRVTFQEITDQAVKKAVASPRMLDLNLVSAQESRRAIDWLVGYEISPVLWKKLESGPSAGRVQSVALRMSVERERTIQSFADRYAFQVSGYFQTMKEDVLKAKKKDAFPLVAEASAYLEASRPKTFSVLDMVTQPVERIPQAPYSTSSLQQDGVKKLKMNVKRVMEVAQKLFEGGHITYIRTDSLNLSDTAITIGLKQINGCNGLLPIGHSTGYFGFPTRLPSYCKCNCIHSPPILLLFMKNLLLFWLLPLFGLFTLTNSQAQNYNAGVGSGTSGSYNVFLGPYTGHYTTGTYNVFTGYVAGYFNTTGFQNSFMGSYAGYSNTTGSQNSFMGMYSGLYNTTGSYNTFLGSSAGYSNSTGYDNNFTGSFAGYSNTTGTGNSFTGSSAGYLTTSGYNNSFTGYKSGFFNTTGFQNSFTGGYAGYHNTTGSQNSFTGSNAGYYNTTGSYNSFTGYQAGAYNNTGNYNDFTGYQAGYSNTTGSQNSFTGYKAGYANTTGASNSFVGYQAGQANTTGNFNLFMGKEAGFVNKGGNNNSFVGTYAGNHNTSGGSNSFVGYKAGINITTGSNNLLVGAYSNASSGTLTNAAAIGYRGYVTTSNSLVLGAINGTNGATASTKVGIGTTAPAYSLHVNGTAAKPGSSAWTVASDKRLKEGIHSFTDGLEVLGRIKPVRFRYNGKADMPTGKEYVGVIAQEMQKIAPYTVGEFTYTDTTGQQEQYLDYDPNALTYILVNSVKEQEVKIEQKDVQIQSLQEQITALQSELAQIKALLLGQSATSNTDAQLWQNEPNPTDGNTLIHYRIPASATSAQIKLYSSVGQELRSFELTQRGKGQLTLAAGSLASGTYVYRLLVDGQEVATRKLVLVK